MKSLGALLTLRWPLSHWPKEPRTIRTKSSEREMRPAYLFTAHRRLARTRTAIPTSQLKWGIQARRR